VRKLNIEGTIQEIKTLEAAANNANGKMAILFDSLKRASEILHSLSNDEFEQLKRDSEKHPILSSILSSGAVIRKSEILTDTNDNLPGFLTVSDVSEMLAISPQSVRKHCAAGKISAWRTLGESGEWRIDIDQYKSHPNFNVVVKKYRKRNREMSEMVANNPELVRQFEQAEERRNDPGYYHNDIERFNKMVDEYEG